MLDEDIDFITQSAIRLGHEIRRNGSLSKQVQTMTKSKHNFELRTNCCYYRFYRCCLSVSLSLLATSYRFRD